MQKDMIVVRTVTLQIHANQSHPVVVKSPLLQARCLFCCQNNMSN